MQLSDRVALITGASRGLGLEIARLYARRGARLVLAARGEPALREVERELASLTDVLAVPVDVSQHAERLADAALTRFGRVDVLINNASTLGPVPMPALADLHYEALADAFRVNATAPLHLAQLLLPQMRARREGVVINVTSDAAVNAYPGWGAYGASKAALEHVTRILAAELEATGVRVYLVDPGDMDTQMHRDALPDADPAQLAKPATSAPAFVHLVERERAPFARIEAQKLAATLARASSAVSPEA